MTESTSPNIVPQQATSEKEVTVDVEMIVVEDTQAKQEPADSEEQPMIEDGQPALQVEQESNSQQILSQPTPAP